MALYTLSNQALDKLAFQYGVGVSTPSYSNRSIYFQQSVSNGLKIQNRINAVGGGVNNMEELVWKEGAPARLAEEKRIIEEKRLADLEEKRLADLEIERLRLKAIDDKFWKDKKDLVEKFEEIKQDSQELESFYEFDNPKITPITFTYPNHVNDIKELEKANEWYSWGLKNVTGLKNANMYSKFISTTRTSKTSTAHWYLSFLKYQNTIRPIQKISEYNERADAISSMEKMKAQWEAKRRIEIPIEIENKRLEDIRLEKERISETKRLQDLENKRLADIEKARLSKLQNDKLILEGLKSNYFQVSEARYFELFNQDYSDLQNFTDSNVIETKPIEETTPIKNTASIMLVLGIGLVSYYLLKGNKK